MIAIRLIWARLGFAKSFAGLRISLALVQPCHFYHSPSCASIEDPFPASYRPRGAREPKHYVLSVRENTEIEARHVRRDSSFESARY